MRKLILHIGTEKTGTTTIQAWLRLQRESLLAAGVLFPVSPGEQNHTALAYFAGQEAAVRDLGLRPVGQTPADPAILRREFAAAFEREVLNSGASTVVLSNEHCSSRLRDGESLQRLRGLLQPLFDDIRIVVYLRRQDEMLLSGYSTSVKSGQSHSLHLPQRDDGRIFNYARFLDRWANVFGDDHLIVRVFERHRFHDGDLLADFRQITGIDALDASCRPDRDKNASFSSEHLEFLRRFNVCMPKERDGALNPDRGDIVPALNRVPDTGKRLSMDAAQRDAFLRLFVASDDEVLRRFFPEQTGPLFSPPADEGGDDGAPELSMDRAFEIFAALWADRQAQIGRLRSRAEGLRSRLDRTLVMQQEQREPKPVDKKTAASTRGKSGVVD